MSIWLNKIIKKRRKQKMTRKYDVECARAFLYLVAKDLKECHRDIIMNFGKGLTSEAWKEDFDFDQAVNMARDAASEYKPVAGTMQEEFERQQKESRVSHPKHYTWLKELCGIEVIDITRHMDFCLGNAIKYILRAGHKTEEGLSDKEKTIEDLKKAIFYINDKIKTLEK